MLKLLAVLGVALLLAVALGSATGSASSCQQSTAETAERSIDLVICAGCTAPIEHGKSSADCAVSCASAYGAILPALPFPHAPGHLRLFPEGDPSLSSLAEAPDPFPPRVTVIL